MLTLKQYAQITGTIFLVVGFVHLMRLFTGWSIIIGGWEVPLWISIVGVLAAWYLAYNAYLLAGKLKK